MIVFISRRTLNRLEKIMSQFLADFRASLEKVAQGGADDAETKQAVADLKTQIEANDAMDDEMKTAIMELVSKLAESTPPSAGSGSDGSTGTGDGTAA